MIFKQYGGLVGTRLSSRQVAALDGALRRARSYGWRVVGVSMPFAPHSVQVLESTPATATLLERFRGEIPGVFARNGYPFLDLTDVASVPCGAGEFTGEDEGHPDIVCSARIRAKLDAAARTITPPPAR